MLLPLSLFSLELVITYYKLIFDTLLSLTKIKRMHKFNKAGKRNIYARILSDFNKNK